MDWKKTWSEFRLNYLIMEPGVNPKNKESRQNWILFMANKTNRYPVRKVYDRFLSSVTKMTINNDFRELEEKGLIKREKDSDKFSFVVPLFEDSGEAVEPKHIRYRNIALDIGLPILTVGLFIVFVMVQ